MWYNYHMSNWNSNYTHRKQKEMMEKAIADNEQKPTNPVYPNNYQGWTTGSSWQKKRQQEQHDKFCWRIGFFIMTIITGLFIWFLIEVL